MQDVFGEPYSEPTIVELPEQHTIVVKAKDLPREQMVEFFDASYAAVGQVIGEQGLGPERGAMARFDTMPAETVDLEAGFIVERPLTEPVTLAEGRVVEASTLPGGKTVAATHMGPYDGLGDAWGRLVGWSVEQGYQPSVPSWEIYVSEPFEEPDKIRTDLFMPL